MKIIYWLLLCIAFTGCGPKSDEEKAMDLVRENLKTTLPDFNNYSSLNFGKMGTASLPYEETSQYLAYKKSITQYKDSMLLLQKLITADSVSATAAANKVRLQELRDSSTAQNERNKIARQGYTPEKLYKLTHAYNLKDQYGNDKKTEAEFFIDEHFTKVVKMHKLY
jgi:hypothetical protein